LKTPDRHDALKIEERDRRATIFFSGRIDLEAMESLNAELDAFWRSGHPKEIAADLSGVTYLDSAGALLLLLQEKRAKTGGIPFRFLNRTEGLRGIMNLVNMEALQVPPLIPAEKGHTFSDRAAGAAVRTFTDFIQVMSFVGELLTALTHALFHPFSVRWNAVLFYMKRVGVDGFPIVTLISLLVGVIIAFMSSLQLKQFGAVTYVASLVGFAMVRELGPLMTAIIVAGRSGSAFCAEIGSMMINEEVDALTTMGFDPIRFLAVPKVLASVVVVPLLTVYAAFFGIVGGLIIGVAGLELTAYSFIKQAMTSFRIFDVVSSLIKSAVFAMLISSIACQRGFQVRGGAEAVGAATTSAVVSGIFLIVLANSAFAVVLYYIH
jgi:phospholipid/cholesterol/gamma-HCH transport system permease protein